MTCPECNGTGRVVDHATAAALAGATHVYIPVEKTCSRCNGTGKVE